MGLLTTVRHAAPSHLSFMPDAVRYAGATLVIKNRMADTHEATQSWLLAGAPGSSYGGDMAFCWEHPQQGIVQYPELLAHLAADHQGP